MALKSVFHYVFMKEDEYYRIQGENDRKFRQLQDKIRELQLTIKDNKQRHAKADEEQKYYYERLKKEHALLEHRYEKVCKENRHLEAEIKRMKERR